MVSSFGKKRGSSAKPGLKPVAVSCFTECCKTTVNVVVAVDDKSRVEHQQTGYVTNLEQQLTRGL